MQALAVSAAHSQSDVTVYTPSQNEINALADCGESYPNVELTYDPLSGYSLIEGSGSDGMTSCLVERHGWQALEPPEYVRGTARSPRWHDFPLPDVLDDFERGMVARDRGELDFALSLLGAQARQGHAGAQYNLGVMHEEGEGVDQDLSKALIWYVAAAENGHVDAQFRLGELYDEGDGVAEDDEEAVRWYLAAAEQGDLAAQIIVGASYALGEGVPEDFVRTYMWYSIAAAQVTRGSMEEMLVQMALEDAGGRLTSSEIRAARKLARQWLSEHSDR